MKLFPLLATLCAAELEYVAWHQRIYTNQPAARTLAPAVMQHTVSETASLGRYAWMFGGLDSQLGALNDLWKLNLLNGAWTEQIAGGTPPTARRGASLVLYEQRSAYLFGGEMASGVRCNDLWVLNVAQGQTPAWTDLATNVTGDKPGVRTEHTAVYAPLLDQASGAPNTAPPGMLIFGGLDVQGRSLDDLHELNLQTFMWSSRSPGGMLPQARKGHASCLILNTIMAISMGSNQETVRHDTRQRDTPPRAYPPRFLIG